MRHRALKSDDRERRKALVSGLWALTLALKWIRVLWRYWVDRAPYDESALQKRHSPLLTFAAESAS